MAKRTSKARKTTKREVPPSYSLASSTVAERTAQYNGSYNYEDYALIAKSISGTVSMAANINASVCTSQRLRLYRTGGAERVDKRFWKGKAVAAKRLASRLKSWRGSKAAEYAEEDDGIEEVKEHPVLDLLNKPDPMTPGNAWMHNFYWFRQTAGRVYAFMGDTALGLPVSAYMLYPQYVRIKYDQAGLIAGYWYGRSTVNQVLYPVEDVDYYRSRPNPVNPLGAASWVQTIIPENDLEAAALQSEIARWGNGSFPGLILEANENTTDPQIRQMENALMGAVQGLAKSGNPLILRSTKVTQFGNKPNEMGYIPGQERCEKRIYDAAGIPESIYRLNSANLASAEVGNAQYMRQTIRPMVNAAADEFTHLLLPRFGLEPGTYFFAYDDPVGEDMDATADRMLAGVLAATVTPNEYRKVMGLDPLDEEIGDCLRFQGQSLSVLDAPPAPAGLFGMGGSNGTGVQDPEMESDPASPPDGEGEGDEPAGEKTAACACGGCGDVGSALRKAGGVACQKNEQGQLTRKAWDQIISRKARPAYNPETGLPKSLDAELNKLAGNLSGWYQNAYTELSATVTPTGNVGNLRYETLVALDQTITDGLYAVLRESAKVGVQMVGSDPEAFQLKPEAAIAYAKTRGAQSVVTVPATMRESLAGTISEGLAAGDGVSGLRDRVASVAPDLAGWQAERIARTESSFAYQEGNLQAWGQLGVDKKAWRLSGSPCEVCQAWADANPNPIQRDAMFTLNGETLRTANPHPNCGCDVVPVLPEDDREYQTLIGTGPLEAVS